MPLNRQPVPLKSFAPDIDVITPGIITNGNDFVPVVRGVRTLPLLHRVTEALPEECIGACMATFADGTQYVVAGTANTLNVIPVQSLSAATPASWGTQDFGVSIPGPVRWRFAFYGDWVIAVDGARPPQYATQASFNAGGATAWSDLPGSPPYSNIVASSDFSLFLIGESAVPTAAVSTNRWWSSVNASLWTPSIATATVTSTLSQTPGPIVGARALRSSMILYKRSSIFVGSLAGPPLIWSFQQASRQVGAVCHESIVAVGDVHYFLGPDDWYRFDAFNLQRLPNRHREWFFQRVGETGGLLDTVVGRYDAARACIFWHYATNANAMPNEWVCLNVDTGNWTCGQRRVEMSPVSVSPDTVQSVDYGPTSGLFLDDNCFYLYGPTGSGASANSFVTTGAIGDRTTMYQLSRVRPGTAHLTGTPTVTPLSAYTPGNPFVAGTPVSLSADGWFNMLNTARLQQLKFETSDDWEMADYDVTIKPVGDV